MEVLVSVIGGTLIFSLFSAIILTPTALFGMLMYSAITDNWNIW